MDTATTTSDPWEAMDDTDTDTGKPRELEEVLNELDQADRCVDRLRREAAALIRQRLDSGETLKAIACSVGRDKMVIQRLDKEFEGYSQNYPPDNSDSDSQNPTDAEIRRAARKPARERGSRKPPKPRKPKAWLSDLARVVDQAPPVSPALFTSEQLSQLDEIRGELGRLSVAVKMAR